MTRSWTLLVLAWLSRFEFARDTYQRDRLWRGRGSFVPNLAEGRQKTLFSRRLHGWIPGRRVDCNHLQTDLAAIHGSGSGTG